MGIIIKQSIKGSIWSYAGVAVGFITTAYLYPNYLSTEMVGLFGLLLSYSVLFAQFSSLGINGVTSRLFPYFRDKAKGHNGFLYIVLLVVLVGFSLFVVVFLIFSPWLIESNLEKSKLFADYVYLLIPLTFFMLIYSVFDIYNKLLYNAVLGTFLQEFFQRVLIFGTVVLYALGLINSLWLIVLFVMAVCVKTIYLIIYLSVKGEIKLKPKSHFITKKLRKEMSSVAVYSILTGVGGGLVFSLDKILVNQFLGLSNTGIYTIAFFFGTLVLIPSRPLLRISGTLIADAWKRDDREYIADIYSRSCINQFIIAAFLFGGIWINIDNILVILGPEYEGTKWVIFFIGLANVVEMATGANAQIIAYSKHYKVVLYFLLALIILVIVSMVLFIPLLGIVGAAIAIAVSVFANNIMRFVFILWKYKMQPFSNRFFIILLVFIISFILAYIIPSYNFVFDLIIKSFVFAIVSLVSTYFLLLSEDFNKVVLAILKRLKILNWD